MSPLLLLLLTLFSSSSVIISSATSSRVIHHTHFPGFDGSLPFSLETGYVAVEDVELFYYFIQSERDPIGDPLVLWLNGGPGCTAFSGLVFEIVEGFCSGGGGDFWRFSTSGEVALLWISLLPSSPRPSLSIPRAGPLKFRNDEYNGSLPTLYYHPYSWTKVSSIIFIDSPVGSGYSYSRHDKGYEVGDISSSKQAHKFLLQWLSDHPQFFTNDFYVAGDSYGGKVAPVVMQDIIEGIDAGIQPSVNLKGYFVGNPVTGDKIDENSRIPFLHGLGIISDELYELAIRYCEGQDHRDPSTEACADTWYLIDGFYNEIQKGYILEPACVFALTKPEEIVGHKRFLNEYTELKVPPTIPPLWCRNYTYYLSYYWANSNITREALDIKKGTVREWQRCDHLSSYSKDIPSSIEYHFRVSSRGYRSLVYSGDHDAATPFLGTQAWIRSLNFSIVDDWHSWRVWDQVAGYARTYANNMTFATVKNAGHTAPEYQPETSLAMIRRWLSYERL